MEIGTLEYSCVKCYNKQYLCALVDYFVSVKYQPIVANTAELLAWFQIDPQLCLSN